MQCSNRLIINSAKSDLCTLPKVANFILLSFGLFCTFYSCFFSLSFANHSTKLPELASASNYVQLSAKAKRDFLWDEGILSSEFSKLPPFENIKILQLFFLALKKKMDHRYDFRPKGWEKPIHRRSVVAKVKFIPAASPRGPGFSGVFSHETLGLIRVSLTYAPKKRGVAPGIALKLFIDKKPSLDVSFLTGLESHGQNYNFFAKPFSNMIPNSKSFGARIVSAIFKRVQKRTNFIGHRHLAEVTPTGNPVAVVRSPNQLFLVGNKTLDFSELPRRDIREDFLELKPGLTLLDVYAFSNKKNKNKDLSQEDFSERLKVAHKIGEIFLESRFVASRFGDDQLFFRHERYKN